MRRRRTQNLKSFGSANATIWLKNKRRPTVVSQLAVLKPEHYIKMRNFILDVVRTHGELTIFQLIDRCKTIPSTEFSQANIISIFLDVKKDMEARGILRVGFLPDRMQVIRLNKKFFEDE